jgi:hypothetical protein
MGVGENGAMAWVVLKYSYALPRTKLWKGVHELKDHVGHTTPKCVIIHYGFH